MFGGIKKLIGKTKQKNIYIYQILKGLKQSQYNSILVDNQYQQKYEVLSTFVPNKCYAYLPNLETCNLEIEGKAFLP